MTDDMIKQAARWWLMGCDTTWIAHKFSIHESYVYSHIQAIKAEAAQLKTRAA